MVHMVVTVGTVVMAITERVTKNQKMVEVNEKIADTFTLE